MTNEGGAGRDPSSAAEWAAVAGRWRHTRRQALWRAHSDAVNLALCRRWWPAQPVRSVLKTDLFDEAFGDGLAGFLHDRSEAVTAIDATLDVVREAARSHAPARGLAADVRHLPFRDGTFDLVLSNSTLDHFREPAEIAVGLREIHRVAVPGGLLLLTLDNPSNPAVALRNRLPFPLVHQVGLVPYYVGATLSAAATARLLAETGFSVEASAVVMHCPRVLGVGLAAVCERLGGRRAERAFLRAAAACEALGRWPTRAWTGYFTAFLARRTS